MKTKFLRLEDLDRHLDALAADPEGFAAGCRDLARSLDADGVALERPDPRTWRGETGRGETGRGETGRGSTGRVAGSDPLRRAIDAIELQDREDEARLARRIDLQRRSFDQL